MDDFEYQCLPLASRALAPMLWLLASEYEDPNLGLVEYSTKKLAFRLRVTEKEIEAALNPLIEQGFFVLYQDASKTLAEGYSDDSPETYREEDIEKKEKECAKKENLEFDYLWELYDFKKDKAESLKVFSGCQNSYQPICQAIPNYKNYLKATGYSPCSLAVWLRNKRWENDYKKLTEQFNETNSKHTTPNRGFSGGGKSQSERIAEGIAEIAAEFAGR